MSDEPQQIDAPEIAPPGAPVDQTPALREREPREIVPFTAGGALAAMIPQNPAEYARLAGLLLDAGCVPASYESGADDRDRWVRETRAKLIIGLMKSVEIGVPPITGLNGIMIINNRPTVWGDLAVALIQRSGELRSMEVRAIGPQPQPDQSPDKWDSSYGYRVVMWRQGQGMPYVGEFTVDDAKRAGLWMNHKKKPWVYYPKDMLFNRARAKASRMGFSDVLHGMGIVEEERDIETIEATRPDTAALFSDEPIEDAETDEVE